MFSLGLLGWSFEVQVSIRRLELQVSKLGAEVEIAVSLRRDDIFHEKYKFRRSEKYVFVWALGVEL